MSAINRSIFFFDFDNTLYSHKTKQVPYSALDALNKLKQQGHIICLVSGRGRESFYTFEQALGENLPEIICLLNGQLIYQNQKIVYENAIPALDVKTLFQTADSRNFSYGGYDWDGIVVNRVNDRVRQVWDDFQGELPRVNENLITETRIFQGQLYIYREEAEIFGTLLDDYITNWSHDCLVNLIHKEAGKAKAIRWCLKKFDIPVNQSYGFGDGYNDMDMLQSVGHGIAVRDGFEPLKQIAEYITGTPDEGGIAEALHHYGFLN